MPDEDVNSPAPEPTADVGTPPVAPAAAPPATVSQADVDRMAAIEQRLAAMGDTLQAIATPGRPQGHPQAPADPSQVDPQVRQYLRGQGLSDADIAANYSLIQPFISAAIAQVGAPLAYELQSIRGEIETVKAGGNRKDFPDWDAVAGEVGKIQESARRQGRAIGLQDAYNAAVAANLDSVIASRMSRRAASPASDAAAQAVHNVGQRARTDTNATPTAAELRAMTPEQKAKFWDSVSSRPVQ